MSFIPSVSNCTGTNLQQYSTACSDFCNTDTGGCDNAINTFCNGQVSILQQYPDVCGSYMPSQIYRTQTDQLVASFPGVPIGSGNEICYLPTVYLSKYHTKTQILARQSCPDVVQCFLSVNFNNDGTINTQNIQISQSADCKSGGAGDTGTSPTFQDLILPEIQKYKYYLIGVGSGIILLFLLITIGIFSSNSNNRKRIENLEDKLEL